MVEEIEAASVLNDERLKKILENALGSGWKTKAIEVKRASDGLTGFLGDHFRATLKVIQMKSGKEESLSLFIKRVPVANSAKAEFIDTNFYFSREALLFNLFEEFEGYDESTAWHPKAYLCDDNILVMRDLALDGFRTRHYLSTLELPDVMLTATAVARFHAAFADYCTRKSLDQPYNFMQEHGSIMKEPIFYDTPWLRAGAKLSANLIKKFSKKHNNITDLEQKLSKLYIETCDSLREHPETLNVILHRDLWVNNIMFAEDRAVLIDYQCVRYGPPAFDLQMFLNLTTTKEFRQKHGKETLLHYFSVFSSAISPETAKNLEELGYNEQEFLAWCDKGRKFGVFFAISLFPYVLMEPKAAEHHYDNPETYEYYLSEDRTKPVLQHGADSPRYLERQLEAIEEFIERYLLKLY